MPRKKAEPDPVQDENAQDEVVSEVESKEPTDETSPTPRPPRRRISEDSNILALSDEEIGFTAEDSEDAKWGYLAGAVRRRQILTGIVSNVVSLESGNHACAVDFEGMRVLIPLREMTLREWPEDELAPDSVQIFMQRILGATVDFIPAAVDIRNRAAVGSRKAALIQRQKQYYETERVKPGILVACRVLAVGNNAMTVEACGVDTQIYARDVSWEWFSDITDLYGTGDLVIAKVMDVQKDEETGLYSVALSIKAASEHSDKAAFKTIVPNSNYFGEVTGVKNGTFFVRLQSGVNAKTRIYRSKDYPCKHDTVSFRVIHLDEEHLVANGFITRIIKRHNRLR